MRLAFVDFMSRQFLVTLCILLVPDVSLVARIWTATSAPTNYWNAIACSADGRMAVAVATLVSPYYSNSSVYISTNSGATWTPRLIFSNVIWGAVASSADGTKLVAAANGVIGVVGAPMYSSSDSGMTWALNGAPLENWSSIASSADGTRLAATIGFPNLGGIYTSTNSGATWVQTSAPVQTNWAAIASSADGSKLAGASANGVYYPNGQPHTNMGQIYVSTNGGATWTLTSAPSTNWHSVASSADGTRLAAVVSPYGTSGPGPIYISTNSGLTWTKTSAPLADWWSICSSADGLKLFAASDPGPICASANGGATWTYGVSEGQWSSIASSADGSVAFATAPFSWIYRSRSVPQPRVGMSSAGANLTLSWTWPSTNFVLQYSAGPSSAWNDVSTTPGLNLTTLEYQVVILPTNSQGFYRLQSR
jgi:hypothetical protein